MLQIWKISGNLKMSNSVTRKELNVLINLAIVYPKYYAEYITKASVRRQEREKAKREITHTHVKAFSQTLFSYLLSNMNLSYNHCYKIQLILLYLYHGSYSLQPRSKKTPKKSSRNGRWFFVVSQTRARRAVYTEGEDRGGEGVGVGGGCYFILK